MRELVQNIVALCVMESGEHLFPRCRRSAHAHVFKDGSFEQFAVLKDISDGIVQRLPVNILDVDAAHFDRARRRIPKTGYKSRSRRLSSAGGPYKRHRFTRFYIKSDAVDGVPVRTFICKRHVLKRNGIILRGLCGADGSGSGLIAKIPSIRCKASETIILFSLINMTFISVTEMMGVKMI